MGKNLRERQVRERNKMKIRAKVFTLRVKIIKIQGFWAVIIDFKNATINYCIVRISTSIFIAAATTPGQNKQPSTTEKSTFKGKI